jgi:hypothetical protein
MNSLTSFVIGIRFAFARRQSLGMRSSRIFGLYIHGFLLSKNSDVKRTKQEESQKAGEFAKGGKFLLDRQCGCAP